MCPRDLRLRPSHMGSFHLVFRSCVMIFWVTWIMEIPKELSTYGFSCQTVVSPLATWCQHLTSFFCLSCDFLSPALAQGYGPGWVRESTLNKFDFSAIRTGFKGIPPVTLCSWSWRPEGSGPWPQLSPTAPGESIWWAKLPQKRTPVARRCFEVECLATFYWQSPSESAFCPRHFHAGSYSLSWHPCA